MCGIAAILQDSSSGYSLDHLKKMTQALLHRGPDGEGYWQNETGSVLMGHRRLSIIDLSEAGKQPMCSPRQAVVQYNGKEYTIIHNGEIYNYIELREILAAKGYAFSSRTDTEVIMAAYDLWKENCVDYFDGMFAFAIWNESEQLLFAARDRFGEKPLYYHFNGKELILASEIKAFWAVGIPKIPNLKMLFNFITIGYTDNPTQPAETFFENIFKVPAASSLSFKLNSKELTLEKYWDIDPEDVNKKITDGEALSEFERLLTQSVKKRLRSDVNVGTSLSGGLDSSSITALASSLKGDTEAFSSFTGTFPGFEKDELSYAGQVANRYGVNSFHVNITADQLLADWDQFSFQQEEPVGSSSVFAQFKVYELAKQQGVKVLLDGQGADEILAGYEKYYKWYWQELFRNRKLFGSKELSAAASLGIREGFGFKNMIAAYFPSFATVALENQYLLKAIRHEDLTKVFVKLQSKEAYYTRPDHYTLNGVLHFNTFTHGLEELLRYADRNAMAHGREVRLPFLSHELVEFVFSLPSSFKIRKGWTKWLLRESMKEKLPKDIVWRKDKIGFETPQLKWMQDPSVVSEINKAKNILVKEGVLKPEVLQKNIRPQNAHDSDNYDWRYFSAAKLFT